MPTPARSTLLAALLAAVLAAPTLAQPTYCTASAAACSTAGDEYIRLVDFNTIHALSGGPAGCYTDSTNIATTVSPGNAYTISVQNGNNFAGDQCAAWVDWNQDGTFGDVASGEEFILSPDAAFANFTGIIPIPTSATLGATRLRIRLQYSGDIVPCGALTYGETEDYTLTIVAPTTGACCDPSGSCSLTTPAACPGNASNFRGLGMGCIPSNPCGGACCDATGACTVTLSTTCPSASAYVDHGSCTPDACHYCSASAANCASGAGDERISEVVIGTIDNPSGAGDGSPDCYGDFTFFSTNVLPGQSYPITVSNAGAFTQDAVTVWVDWNHDFAFGTGGGGGANEQFPLTSDGTGATFTGSITVPTTALIGPVRMRIRLVYDTVPLPCGGAEYGETEDYILNVTGTGTCCANQSCTFTTLDGCANGIYHDGGSCSPNPCLAPGVCCRGCTCNINITNPALCTLSVSGANAGAVFASTAFACNPAANTTTPCCLADYNKQAGLSPQDIFDFLNDWFANSHFAVVHGDGLHGSPAIQDIFDFLNAWFAGC